MAQPAALSGLLAHEVYDAAENCGVCWGESLPTRSRADTAQTQVEIAESYADFVAACPGAAGLVP